VPCNVENGSNASKNFKPSDYMEPSPFESDAGNYIGKDPRKLSKAMLDALGGPQNPIKAIRAHCIDCSGGSAGEVRKCTANQCPLWTFRMSKNVHHKRSKKLEA